MPPVLHFFRSAKKKSSTCPRCHFLCRHPEYLNPNYAFGDTIKCKRQSCPVKYWLELADVVGSQEDYGKIIFGGVDLEVKIVRNFDTYLDEHSEREEEVILVFAWPKER
jgi:hypothetical protein